MNYNKSVPLTVKKIVNGAYGLSNLPNGKTVFIRRALPGETVTVRITEDQEKICYADTVEVIDAHPARITPPCSCYAGCGGCDLQHAEYRLQCSLKKEMLTELLQRNRTTGPSGVDRLVEPVLGSDEHFGYRQRIRVQVNIPFTIGFNRFRSHEITPVNTCLLAPSDLNRYLAKLSASPVVEQIANHLKEIELLRDPDSNALCIILHLTRKPRAADRKTALYLAEETGDKTRVFLAGSEFAMEGPFCEDPDADAILSMTIPGNPPITLTWEAGGFCQVNHTQNLKLIQTVIDWARPAPERHLLDLYCGMGNFSLKLAELSASVFGIESQGAAIRSAKRNCVRNTILNAEFLKSDVKKGCELLVSGRKKFDAIVCDPPRQGMTGLAPLLGSLCRNRLVYVSCDPATLCRDLAELLANGFSVRKILPIDMFPQTRHLETVTLLERSSDEN